MIQLLELYHKHCYLWDHYKTRTHKECCCTQLQEAALRQSELPSLPLLVGDHGAREGADEQQEGVSDQAKICTWRGEPGLGREAGRKSGRKGERELCKMITA